MNKDKMNKVTSLSPQTKYPSECPSKRLLFFRG